MSLLFPLQSPRHQQQQQQSQVKAIDNVGLEEPVVSATDRIVIQQFQQQQQPNLKVTTFFVLMGKGFWLGLVCLVRQLRKVTYVHLSN
jgi:hypothetical protein